MFNHSTANATLDLSPAETDARMRTLGYRKRESTHCAFCKRSRKEIKRLIYASEGEQPDITICDACVSICLNVIMEGPSPAYFIGGCV